MCILMFKQKKYWDIVNYEDYSTELEDRTIELKEEELGPQPDLEAYLKESLEVAQKAETASFDRRRRDNNRA